MQLPLWTLQFFLYEEVFQGRICLKSFLQLSQNTLELFFYRVSERKEVTGRCSLCAWASTSGKQFSLDISLFSICCLSTFFLTAISTCASRIKSLTKFTTGNSPSPFTHRSDCVGRAVLFSFLFCPPSISILLTCQSIYMNKIYIKYAMVSGDVLENLPLNKVI